MSRLDRLVTTFRRWVENTLPWYDREAERRAHARTERIRQKSIQRRIRAEAVRAQQRIAR